MRRNLLSTWLINITITVLIAATSAVVAAKSLDGATVLAPDEVILGTTKLFIPQGFDDNDHVVVVVDTELPSTCYELTDADYQVDIANRAISVAARARRLHRLCLPVTMPTSVAVDVGILPKGDFTVVTNNGWLTEKLPVRESTSAGPDDERYADVQAVWLDFAPNHVGRHHLGSDSRYSAVIEARRYWTCEVLDRIEVIDSGRTYELLPIMKMEDGVGCDEVNETFQMRAPLPELSSGRFLLHVRSQNGRSVNQVVTVDAVNSER